MCMHIDWREASLDDHSGACVSACSCLFYPDAVQGCAQYHDKLHFHPLEVTGSLGVVLSAFRLTCFKQLAFSGSTNRHLGDLMGGLPWAGSPSKLAPGDLSVGDFNRPLALSVGLEGFLDSCLDRRRESTEACWHARACCFIFWYVSGPRVAARWRARICNGMCELELAFKLRSEHWTGGKSYPSLHAMRIHAPSWRLPGPELRHVGGPGSAWGCVHLSQPIKHTKEVQLLREGVDVALYP